MNMHGNVATYFEKNRAKPKFLIGDKVWGKYQGVMFRGTVGNDHVVDSEPVVSVHLYLPLTIDGKTHNILFVSQEDLKLSKVS